MNTTQRPKLYELRQEQIAALERKFSAQWSETWKDLARSCYATLLCHTQSAAILPEELAVQIVLGIAEDLGGTQPYIPIGLKESNVKTVEEVMALLDSGHGYKSVSDQCGITVHRVRRIEREHRRRRFNSGS